MDKYRQWEETWFLEFNKDPGFPCGVKYPGKRILTIHLREPFRRTADEGKDSLIFRSDSTGTSRRLF